MHYVVQELEFLSLVAFNPIFLLFIYSVVIHQFESDGPVERWMEIGFKRHRLEMLRPGDVLLSLEDYDAAMQQLLREETSVVSDTDFPRDREDLARYKQARSIYPVWPVLFWSAFVSSVAVAIATTAWLQGASAALASVDSEQNEPS